MKKLDALKAVFLFTLLLIGFSFGITAHEWKAGSPLTTATGSLSSDTLLFVDFDTEGSTENWTALNGNNTNQWYVSQAQGFDNAKLFISSSNGQTNKYNVNRASDVVYQREITTDGNRTLSFDIRVSGESEHDYLEVLFNDSSYIKISNIPYWDKIYIVLAEGTGMLKFRWVNDGNGIGAQFPAALDNITLTTGTCAVPTALRMVTNTSNSVKLAWDGPSAANYKLEYKLAHSLDNYTSLIVQGNTTVDINGLLQNKSYIARIQTLCDETVLSGYSNQIVFQTQSSCFPPILQSSVNISSSVATINWGPAEGDTTTTLWEARLKKTNINEEWIYVRVNQVNFLNFSNLDRGTSYDVQLRAICDEWSESDWTPVLTFVSGCDVIELPYEQLFNGVNGDPMPDCWKGSDFTIQTGRATSTIATGINNVQHWLISPGFKIPEEGTITMEYTVQTTAMQDKYDIMISYRGTAEENFESIRNGETNSIVIPSERAGQVIYVAFVHKAPGAFNVDNIRISGCINKTIPSTLTVSELNPTSAKVSWRMQNNHQAAQYYIKCHVLTGLHAGETLLYYSDTTVATIDLYENSTYTISAGAVCQGNLFGFPTNEVNCTTGYICPAPVLLNLASTDITASGAAIRWNKKGEANVWYLQYRLNRNEADTLFCAPILIENDTFYVLDNLNEFTDYHVEVKISSYCGNGNYLVVPNTKEYYFHTPYRCPLPKNFKIENITGTSVDLRWTKGNQETEWTIQYGRIGFEPGTGSLINIEDTTYTKITGLTYGDSLDFYIKADCHDTLSSLWVGPLTALIADRYIMQKENTILVEACQGMLFDNGGATDNYKSNSLDTMIIIPQANSLAQLTGNYHVEGSSYDYITIYDGEGTTGTVLATLKGKGRIDALTSLSGSLTLCFKSDVSLEYTGFEFILNCTPIPTCSEPKNVTYNPANSILSWDQNRWGTADHYDVQVRLTTDTTHTTSYTVNGIEKELTSLLSNTAYEARVITYCGETEHSDWTPWFVFNTPCLSYAVPFIENFDEITAFPNCWSRNNNSTSVDTNHTLYFGSSNYPIAVTPPLNVTSARDLKVKFKAFMGTTLVSSGLSIGVMENSNDFTTFKEISKLATSSTNTWETFEVSLDTFTGIGKHIAFKWNSSYYSCKIDSLVIDYLPDCRNVYGLTVGTITTNGAVLTWNYSNHNNPVFEIEYGTPGFAHGSGTVISVSNNSTTYPLTGLNMATFYDVYVRAKCGDIYTNWSNKINFRTECGTVTELPYSESFESTTVPADCWDMKYANANHPLDNNMIHSTSESKNDSSSFRFSSFSSGSPYDQYLISPEFDISGGMMVSFWHKKGSSGTEKIQFGYSTTGKDIANFTWNTTISPSTIWTKYEQRVPAGTKYVAIHYLSNYQYYVYIDQFEVMPIPTCGIPHNLTYNQTTHSFSWVADTLGTPESYNLRYRQGTNGNFTTLSGITSTSQIVNALLGSTAYQAQVQANCGTDQLSTWSELISFTTQCAVITQFPIIESFESNNAPATCWSMIYLDASHPFDNDMIHFPNEAKNGSRSFRFSSISESEIDIYDQYLISPEFTASENLQVSFWHKKGSSGTEKIQFGYSTTGKDIANFTWNTTILPSTIWTKYEQQIPAGTKYVAIHYFSNYQYYVYIDQFEISRIPTCIPPSNLIVQNVQQTTANLQWTPNGTNKSKWIIEYDTAGYVKGKSRYTQVIDNGNQHTVALTGLQPNTRYEGSVRGICTGTDTSEYSNILTFKTLCLSNHDFPYMEDFDETTFPPTCWTEAHTQGTATATWVRNTTTKRGTGSAQLEDQQSGNKNNLITQLLEIPTANGYELSFWIYRSHYSSMKYKEGVKVWINSTPDTINATPLMYIPRQYNVPPVVPTKNTWYQYTAVIPNAGAQYIIFEGISEYGSATYIDDIMVVQRPPCFAQTEAPVVTNITKNSATVTWEVADEETTWDLSISDGETETITRLNNNIYQLTGLENNTTYHLLTRSICSETDSSKWSPELNNTFTTLFCDPVDKCNLLVSLGRTNHATGWEGATLEIYEEGTIQAIYTLTLPTNTNTLDTLIRICHNADIQLVWKTGNSSGAKDNECLFTLYDPTGDILYEKIAGIKPANKSVLKTFVNNCNIPTCLRPNEISVTEIESNTAMVDWVNRGDATTWEIKVTSFEGTQTYITHTHPYTLTGLLQQTNYSVEVQSWCSETDSSSWSLLPAIFKTASNVEASVRILPIFGDCSLEKIPVQFEVTNTGYGAPIEKIAAQYRVHTSSSSYTSWIKDTFSIVTPLAHNETVRLTFDSLYTFETTNNYNVNIQISVEEDYSTDNNSASTPVFTTIEPQTVDRDYKVVFDGLTVPYGWSYQDLNEDNITWGFNNKAVYPYNDTLQANDLLLSRCLNLRVGKYEISYDYKTSSPLMESFVTFIGSNIDEENYEVIERHQNITNEEFIHFSKIIDITADNIYKIAFLANSLAGNMGLVINNFRIMPVIELVVKHGPYGTIEPNTMTEPVYVQVNNPYKFGIYPQDGYHIKSIAVKPENGESEIVREEDLNNSRFEFFTYEVGTTIDTIHVQFEVSEYPITASIRNFNDLNYFDDPTVRGTITPATDTVLFGDPYVIRGTVQPNYHLSNLYIDGIDMIRDRNLTVTNDRFVYRFSAVHNPHMVEAVVKLDTFMIYYHILEGEGFVDHKLATANMTVFTSVDYTSDWRSSIMPADGYRIQNVVVDGSSFGAIQQWQFENVITDHNIEVRFVPNEYTITTESYGYGTITPGETFVYNPDHTYNLVITPNEGYHISAITINDIPINNFNPAGYTQLLTSISKNCVIKAYFAINAYTITASTGGSGMGTVMPQGTMTFDYGDSVTYTANATEGNYISKVIVDGITTNFTLAQNKTSWSITYPSITSNHNLEVQFTAKKFKVTVSTGINGSITPGTQNNIIAGENRTFTISPNVNYHTLRVIVDGDTLGGLAQYTFVNIVENHTIKADFSQNQYTIYAQSNNASYGTINHAGVYTVNTGANAQYSVNAQEGYYIQSITVDNVSIAIPSFVSSHNFTIPNVQANHNIFVTFAQKQVTITVIPVENAMITPETNTFAYQATPTFTIIPVTGYQVTHVLIDGVQTAVTSDATGMATYQFAALTTPHTFSVMVTPKIYTITVNAGSNGAIQTTGDNNIPFGNSKVYNIIANQGYEIETVEVDHVSMGVINSYSFLNVTNHHTIAATFKRIHCEAPTDLFTSHITLDSAKLHWTSIYSNVFLYYKKVSDAQYGTPISVSNLNSYQLTGLDANTRYVWKVQVTCDENTVDSYESTFTTPLSSGMENISLESIKVYGNRNNVYIVNDHQVRIDEVAIYDIYGKQIYQGKTVNNPEVIQLMVANGNYIVRLTTEHGMCVYKINLAR